MCLNFIGPCQRLVRCQLDAASSLIIHVSVYKPRGIFFTFAKHALTNWKLPRVSASLVHVNTSSSVRTVHIPCVTLPVVPRGTSFANFAC